tara:strand:+ start:10165 stop:10908 length:744 start_codon:yes stop_codon:yes gene_type:complete
MSILNKIVSPEELVEKQGAKLLVYGAAGAGKTKLCATAPGKVLVISAEAGLLSIRDAKNVDAVEVKEAAEVMEFHKALDTGELDYDTVCLDSISEISEILLNHEKSKSKDARQAYMEVQTSVTNVMRAFRDLQMNVIFICKMDKMVTENSVSFEPKMVGAKLGQAITYFFDEVLALRVIEDQDEEGNMVKRRWLQTDMGQNYTAKDRSGKLEPFEQPDLTSLLIKLGFSDVKSEAPVVKKQVASGGE